MATLKERNRIAREIHDNVGHMLSRAILQMGALSTVYEEEPLHGQLLKVNDTLNLAMNNIRESVHDLHDDSVDLKQALLEATREMKQHYHLELEYDMSQNVPRKVKYCFIVEHSVTYHILSNTATVTGLRLFSGNIRHCIR